LQGITGLLVLLFLLLACCLLACFLSFLGIYNSPPGISLPRKLRMNNLFISTGQLNIAINKIINYEKKIGIFFLKLKGIF